MNFHVAVDGNDAWSGQLPEPTAAGTDGPFATIGRAQDAVRQVGGPARVTLGGGKHFLSAPVVFGPEHSGTADAPTVYTVRNGEEVRLIGGAQISGWQPVSDPGVLARLTPEAREHVRQIDLASHGITDYGRYHPRGHSGGMNVAALELFYNQQVMTVSRWPKTPPLPNRGYLEVADVIDDPEKGKLIRYEGDRPSRWAASNNIHAHGYWGNDWSSSINRIETIDTERKLLTPAIRDWCAYGVRKGQRFFFFHILEELSQPGEWYLDFESGVLYFWPPDDGDGEAIVSLLEEPMLQFRGASQVRFERLTVECMRGTAIRVEGGQHVTVAGCKLRNVGQDAVQIIGGADHAIVSCDISYTGECGVRINAGDRRTLTPCNHRVHNCHMHHIAREGWTYFGAVWLDLSLEFGCGVLVSHNRMHEHRHALGLYKGNDHLFEYNELYNCTLEGDDCGAIYTGRDTAMQGNVVRYNHFHHVGDSGRNDWGAFGVYMDDGGGGTEIYGNVFHWIDKAVLAGGGMNIRIHDNIFVDCRPAIWFDERGASAGADGEGSMFHGFMKDCFQGVGANNHPYDKYPHIEKARQAYRDHLGLLAWGGAIIRNIVVGSGGNWLTTLWPTIPDRIEFGQNMIDREASFVAPKLGIFELRPDSPAFDEISFEGCPDEPVGLIHDEYRTQIVDVWCGIEVVSPVGANGEPGRARLVAKNVGDVDVSGMELVEFKTARHGPGVSHAEVPYRVPAGETATFEFAITVPKEHLADVAELYVCSRGEYDLRPAWSVVPLTWPIEGTLEVLEPVVAGTKPKAASVRCNLKNRSDTPVSTSIRITAAPDGAATIRGDSELAINLAPGADTSTELGVTANPDFASHCPSRITLKAHADELKPTAATAIVQYPLPQLGAVRASQVRDALADQPLLPIKGGQRGTTVLGHRGDVKLGLAGEALAFYGLARDSRPVVTDMVWDGSCFEVFGCSPDRERIGHVFGALRIGQVYLVPAVDGQPARAARVVEIEHEWMPDVEVVSTPTGASYEIQAIIPLELLAVSPGAEQFLFEVQVATREYEGKPGGHASLFGSHTAFNDSTSYAMAVRGSAFGGRR